MNKSPNKKYEKMVEIPNFATKSPVPLMDAAMIANLAYLGFKALRATTPAGLAMITTNALFAAYAGCSIVDYIKRMQIKKIDFMDTYGADVKNFKKMPENTRKKEISDLIQKVNDEYTSDRYERTELAEVVDMHLTDYIENITGQEVITSTKIREWGIAKFIMPGALGACDVLSGEVYVFKNMDVFEPHVIAHEFAHRKGYLKELDAQVLAYLSHVESKDPILVQSANCERLSRNIAAWKKDRNERRDFIENSKIRDEIKKYCISRKGGAKPTPEEERLIKMFEDMYDHRMKVTGQNGISDYDEGFTSFLYTIGK